MLTKTGTLTLATLSQVILFKHELLGQFSDGHWENSGPRDHYQPWCRCDVVIGEKIGTAGFWPRKRNYGLTSKDLLDVVGGRMINLVLMGVIFGEENARMLNHLWDDQGWEMTWKGLPTYEGAYWDEIREKLSKFPLEHVRRVGNGEIVAYDRKSLLTDLRAIRKAMETAN